MTLLGKRCILLKLRVGCTPRRTCYLEWGLRLVSDATRGSLFTARCYASAVLAMGLCLSVTSLY